MFQKKKQTVTPSTVAGSAAIAATDAGSAAIAAIDVGSAAIPAIEVEEGEEDETEDPATVDKASQVPMSVTSHLGWRTSYRTKTPETPNRTAILDNIRRKNKFFAPFQLAEAQRHRPVRPPDDKIQLAKRKRIHDENAYYKKQRLLC